MSTPILGTTNLAAFYGDFQALFGIDLQVMPSEAVALIGANGAGKTTLLRAICGLLPVAGQDIRLEGAPIAGLDAHQITRLGVSMSPEGRRLFPSLTVGENIEIGAFAALPGPWNRARVEALFPILVEKADVPANRLSGGQQQMVAIARALMRNPKLLLLDEVSLGLAPTVIGEIYSALPEILAEGTAILLVEQDISRALAATTRFYCLQEGRVSLQGESSTASREEIAVAYFGKEVA